MLKKVEKGKGIKDIERPESIRGGVGCCGSCGCHVCGKKKDMDDTLHDSYWSWFGKTPGISVVDD